MDPANSWSEEKQSAWLYRALAEAERDSRIADLFRALADAAEDQARTWEKAAIAAGQALPIRFQPSARARLVAHLARRLGPRRVKPALAALKVRGLSAYTAALGGHLLPTDMAQVGLEPSDQHIADSGELPDQPPLAHELPTQQEQRNRQQRKDGDSVIGDGGQHRPVDVPPFGVNHHQQGEGHADGYTQQKNENARIFGSLTNQYPPIHHKMRQNTRNKRSQKKVSDHNFQLSGYKYPLMEIIVWIVVVVLSFL